MRSKAVLLLLLNHYVYVWSLFCCCSMPVLVLRIREPVSVLPLLLCVCVCVGVCVGVCVMVAFPGHIHLVFHDSTGCFSPLMFIITCNLYK